MPKEMPYLNDAIPNRLKLLPQEALADNFILGK